MRIKISGKGISDMAYDHGSKVLLMIISWLAVPDNLALLGLPAKWVAIVGAAAVYLLSVYSNATDPPSPVPQKDLTIEGQPVLTQPPK